MVDFGKIGNGGSVKIAGGQISDKQISSCGMKQVPDLELIARSPSTPLEEEKEAANWRSGPYRVLGIYGEAQKGQNQMVPSMETTGITHK